MSHLGFSSLMADKPVEDSWSAGLFLQRGYKILARVAKKGSDKATGQYIFAGVSPDGKNGIIVMRNNNHKAKDNGSRGIDEDTIGESPSCIKLNTVAFGNGSDAHNLVPRWEFAIPGAWSQVKKLLNSRDEVEWFPQPANYGKCASAREDWPHETDLADHLGGKPHTDLPNWGRPQHPYAPPMAYTNYPDPGAIDDKLVTLLSEFRDLNHFDFLPMGALIHGAFDWFRCAVAVSRGGMALENFPKPEKHKLPLVSLANYLVYHIVNLRFCESMGLVAFLHTGRFALSCMKYDQERATAVLKQELRPNLHPDRRRGQEMERMLAEAIAVKPADGMDDHNLMYDLISSYKPSVIGPIFPSDLFGSSVPEFEKMDINADPRLPPTCSRREALQDTIRLLGDIRGFGPMSFSEPIDYGYDGLGYVRFLSP
ncbi:hypothetical protein F4780DRAFT_215011, partial [Xylariomycetidae sp. FL0641]